MCKTQKPVIHKIIQGYTVAKKKRKANSAKPLKRKKANKPSPDKSPSSAPSGPAQPKSAISALSLKQQAFVREYLIDLNATAAYKRAGYKGKGRTAENGASEILGNPGVQAAIQEQQNARADRLEISADRIIEEIARLAFSSMGQVLDFSGDDVRLLPAHAISENAQRALATMKVKRYLEGHGDDARNVEVTEFKIADKLPALVKLGQHIGMFVTKVEHSGKGGGAIPITIVGVEIVEPKETGSPCPPSVK